MNTTEIRQEFLIEREGSNYPPHHVGDHLEEAFVKFWQKNGTGNRKLIPVHWTAVYNHRLKEGLGPGSPNQKLRQKLQIYLDSLPKNDQYFIVCTHDDAPSERLPLNTLVFAAGGNSSKIDVEIPLTCGPHENSGDFLRTVPISFVGSMTHPIRQIMGQSVQGMHGVFLNFTEWKPDVTTERVDLFRQITQRSIFSLCPRGYGATSYRLYESMQLGAIPVYVSDKHLLPWSDELDWSQFCVLIKPNDIQNILQLTLGLSASKVRKMQENLEGVWENYFSIHATCRMIAARVI